MTRIAGPSPAGPHRHYSDGPPATQGTVQQSWNSQQGAYPAPNPQRRRSRTILIFLGAALLLAVVLGLVYFAYDWINSSTEIAGGGRKPTNNATVIFSGQMDKLNAAKGNTLQRDPSDPSVVWVRSSVPRAKSSGSTEGVSVKVPTSLSSSIQGKRIRVTVSAGRLANDKASPFALAYSTGGAGSSGWIVFQPTGEYKDYSFNYRVPRRSAGFTHYVGIWSDIVGQKAPLAIRDVKITVMP